MNDPFAPADSERLAEDGDYRPLHAGAVIALLLGLLSAAALAHPLLWSVPAAAVALAWASLAAIDRPGRNYAGRPAALAALALGLVFGAAAPSEYLATRWYLERSADRVARTWFEYFQAGTPELAYSLTLAHVARPTPAALVAYFRTRPAALTELQHFAAEPLVRTLVALGEQSQAHWYETLAIRELETGQEVTQTYAITYPAADQRPHTFFVRLTLERSRHPTTGDVRWRVLDYAGGVRPARLEP